MAKIIYQIFHHHFEIKNSIYYNIWINYSNTQCIELLRNYLMTISSAMSISSIKPIQNLYKLESGHVKLIIENEYFYNTQLLEINGNGRVRRYRCLWTKPIQQWDHAEKVPFRSLFIMGSVKWLKPNHSVPIGVHL